MEPEVTDGIISPQLNDARRFIPNLYNSQNLSDVTLEVSGTTFYAHKFILYSSSSFFRALFDSKMKESTLNTITLSDPIGPFTQFLKFLYGVPISFPGKDISQILALLDLANFYDVSELKSSCFSLIPTEELGPWQFLDLGCASNELPLVEDAIKRLLYSLHTYAYNDLSMLDANYESLVALLGHKSYVVSDEKITIDLIFTWTKHKIDTLQQGDHQEIEAQFNKLLEFVQWELVSPEIFSWITVQWELVSPEIFSWITTNTKELQIFHQPTLPFPTDPMKCLPRGAPGSSFNNALQWNKLRDKYLPAGQYWITTPPESIFGSVPPRSSKPIFKKINASSSSNSTNMKSVFTFYEPHFEGYSWLLVRRQGPGKFWKDNPQDKLQGQVTYCTGPEYLVGPNSQFSFSIQFNNIPFDKFLFATGDRKKWLICDKSSVYSAWSHSQLSTVKIEKSHVFSNSYNAMWCKRNQFVEDPWISARDHNYHGINYSNDGEEHSMLYGGGMKDRNDWHYYLKHHDGCNVWIRIVPDEQQ